MDVQNRLSTEGVNTMARLIRYCLPFALLCALAAIASGVGYRLGWWPLGVGFGVLRWAAYVAIVATALAIAAIFVSRGRPRWEGLASALIALVISAATFAIPGTMLIKAKQLP